MDSVRQLLPTRLFGAVLAFPPTDPFLKLKIEPEHGAFQVGYLRVSKSYSKTSCKFQPTPSFFSPRGRYIFDVSISFCKGVQ